MLIIPFDKKLDWKAPPIITILLIVVNSFIYFAFQAGDDEKYMDAQRYYYSSGLAAIELPYFKDALNKQGDSEFVQQWEASIKQVDSPWLFFLQSNKAFMTALNNDEVITPSNSNYAQWKHDRIQLDEKLGNIVSNEYALKAGAPTVITLFSHMFLHGDFSHLFGNMIFLLAVGFIVELAMNRYLYLAAYLLAGVGSALFYIPSAFDDLIPSLGASGAISGLMGMYAVLFGTRKVRFFYFIYVYFDYVKLPAIYLLVLWLGFQIYEHISYSSISNVNYLAHIGGLVSGAAIAYLITKLQHKNINHDYLDANADQERFSSQLNNANALMKELEYEKALPILKRLLDEQPSNRDVLYKYYKASKLDTASAAYHNAAIQVLSIIDNDPASNTLVTTVFNDYIQVKQLKLTPTQLNSLMKRFIEIKALDEAVKVLLMMQTYPDRFSNLPHYLWAMTNLCMKTNKGKQAKQYAAYLQQNYPSLPESSRAIELTEAIND